MPRPTDAQVQALADFALWALREVFMGYNIDGDDAQEKALALGIVHRVQMLERCGDNCACAEWGGFPQTCYRLCDWLLEAAGQTTLTSEDGTNG